MTRTTVLKGGYLVVLILLLALVWLAASYFRPAPVWLVLAGALLLVPGRILGHFWRDLFRGRRLLAAGEYAAAEQQFERFLTRLAEQPWLHNLIWLSWPGYSPDATALTLTNLGAARLQQLKLTEAEAALRAAIARDAKTPLPWYNLGLLYAARRDPQMASEALARARDLGFSGGLSDQVLISAASGLAQLEGFGRSTGVHAH